MRLLFYSLIFTSFSALSQAPAWQWGTGDVAKFWPSGLQAGSSGKLYFCGSFYDSLTLGTFNFTTNGDYDISIAQFDTSGNALWAKIISGEKSEGAGLAADGNGNVYLAGNFSSKQLTIGAVTHTNVQTSSQSYDFTDLFITKLDPTGNFLWSKTYGTWKQEYLTSLAVDRSGNLLVTGYFYDLPLVFGTTTLTSMSPGTVCQQAFVAKLDPSGNIIWAKRFGSSENSYDVYGGQITTDGSRNIIISGGYVNSAIFGTSTLTGTAGDIDVYVTKLDSTGNVIWVKNIQGPQYQFTSSIKTDKQDNIYILGEPGLSASVGSNTYTSCGGTDVLLTKYDPNGNVLWVKLIGTQDDELANDICMDNGNNIYITGKSLNDSIRINGQTVFVSADTIGAFIMKLNSQGNSLWLKAVEGNTSHIGILVEVSNDGDLFFSGTGFSSAIFGQDTISGSSTPMTPAFIFSLAKMHVHNSVITVGTKDAEQVHGLTVYPNPASDEIEVFSREDPVESLIISDLSGRILQSELNRHGVSPFHITLPPVENGVYLLTQKSASSVLTSKIIIQRNE
jgi:hypothetical protein